ncbi:MAG: TonB family protein [Bacteroidales bacterium]|nr:MAG: TonB family protein [Bacteroidales bacterium]
MKIFNENKDRSDLFSPSGCLTLGTIQKFQSGKLNNQEITHVNHHLEECAICRDALEGYNLLKDPGKQRDVLFTLGRRISSKYIFSREKIFSGRKRRLNPVLAYISAAATILIIFGLYGILNSGIFQQEKLVSENMGVQEPEKKEIISRVEQSFSETEPLKSPVERETSKPESHPTAEPEKEDEDKPALQMNGVKGTGGIVTGDTKAADLEEVVILDDEFEAEMNEIPEDTLIIEKVSPGKQVEFVSLSEDGEDRRVRAAPAKSVTATKEDEGKVLEEIGEITRVDEVSYSEVEEMPEFSKRGYKDFEDFIRKNLVYPDESKEQKVTGEVYVQFVINEYGRVVDAGIVSGVDSLLDMEALRVIGSSPRWKPGKQDGKKVKVRYIFPVVFQLND